MDESDSISPTYRAELAALVKRPTWTVKTPLTEHSFVTVGAVEKYVRDLNPSAWPTLEVTRSEGLVYHRIELTSADEFKLRQRLLHG